MIYKLLFIILILVSLILRFYQLGEQPPALNWDEVSHGYNAYSILKTGSDEWGQKLPLANFRAYGDYPLPLYMYLSMPWIMLGGLNEFTIRATSALFGALLVITIFFLTLEVTRKRWLGYMAMFMMTISPWDIMLSRQVLQAMPAILFLSLGVLLFMKGLTKNSWLVVLGLVSLAFSAYGYHNSRIVAPLLIILLFLIYRRYFLRNKKILLVGVISLIILTLPITNSLASGEGSARAVWVSIIDQGAIDSINESRGDLRLPSPLPQLVYNKVTYALSRFSINYINYFNPFYLGIRGGSHYQFSIPGYGIVTITELPFFYIGIFLLLVLVRKSSSEKKFLLGWLLVAPIPAAVTRDTFHVVRATTLLPIFYLVTVLGLDIFSQFLKVSKRIRFILLIAFLIIELILVGRFMYVYWTKYPIDYSFAWQYGYKQVAEYIRQNQIDYEKIIITKKYGEPHEFMLFYLQYDPILYKTDSSLIRYYQSNWFWVDQFGKFEFVNDWEVIKSTQERSNALLITSPGNFPPESKYLKTINFLDGQPAFDIVELR